MRQAYSLGGTAAPATVTFIASAGTKYYILVTGHNFKNDAFEYVGTFTLNVVVSTLHTRTSPAHLLYLNLLLFYF